MKKKEIDPATPTVALRKSKKETQSDRFSRLCEFMDEIRKEGLTGHIKVNFNQGNICKIEKHEEILRD